MLCPCLSSAVLPLSLLIVRIYNTLFFFIIVSLFFCTTCSSALLILCSAVISFSGVCFFFPCITFYSCIVKNGISPMGKFGLSSPGKASCDTVALPNPRCMLGVLCFHNPPNSGVDYGIFNVSTDVTKHAIAHGGVRTP